MKGFDRVSWFMGGLFFGPIAVLAAAGLPDRNIGKRLVKAQVEAAQENKGKPANVAESENSKTSTGTESPREIPWYDPSNYR